MHLQPNWQEVTSETLRCFKNDDRRDFLLSWGQQISTCLKVFSFVLWSLQLTDAFHIICQSDAKTIKQKLARSNRNWTFAIIQALSPVNWILNKPIKSTTKNNNQWAYLRITEEFMEFHFAIGGLCFKIRKYISEQQSWHFQRVRPWRLSVCSAAAPITLKEEAHTSSEQTTPFT